ncbi:MAG: OmpA family protein [Saprospiraceae bacterium]
MPTSKYLLFVVLALIACNYTVKIKDGATAHERKQYDAAIPMLERDFARAKSRTEKGRMAYRIADSYRNTGRDEAALRWFALAYQNNYGAEALKGQGYTLKKLERYDEAKEAFKNLSIEIGSPYEYRKEIAACDIAVGWKSISAESGWTIALAPFNSPQNDFSPTYFPDERIVFSSDRAAAVGKDAYKWTGNKFMDLLITDPEAAAAQPFDVGLNSSGNEGTLCFNRDFSVVYLARAVGAYKGDDQFCKIYTAERTSSGWSEPRPLPFQKEKINYVHPVLAPDGAALFFSSNDPDGSGGYDLWTVRLNDNFENGWDVPKPLSRNINTPGNEVFPTFSGDTLFFSSDGLPGMGGLDIFRSFKLERDAWSTPQNMKPPVNSGADDFGLIATNQSRKNTPLQPGDLLRSGYLTSNRSGGSGGDDIYRIEQRVPLPKPPKVDTTPVKPLVFKMILEGYVLEKILVDPNDPNSRVLGRKPLPGANVDIAFGTKKQLVTVGDDGFFTLDLAENTDYAFAAAKTGYLANSARFSTRGIPRDPANPVQTYEVEIVLDKIYRNREIVLENIYYDYDKWDIRPDAEPTLNRLAEVLRQNPEIRIQLGSHTDCRGNDGYNQDLSQKRAQSAVAYLIGRGIDAARLEAVGYGESQPAVGCLCTRCTEMEHQANRRTTFRILE